MILWVTLMHNHRRQFPALNPIMLSKKFSDKHIMAIYTKHDGFIIGLGRSRVCEKFLMSVRMQSNKWHNLELFLVSSHATALIVDARWLVPR